MMAHVCRLNAPCRHLLAMSVAQAEAVLVAGSCPALEDDEDERLAPELLLAVQFGPPALASSPPVQQALVQVAEMLAVAADDVRPAALAVSPWQAAMLCMPGKVLQILRTHSCLQVAAPRAAAR
jgi:hypothetical protein